MSVAEVIPPASNALAAFMDDPASVLREEGLIEQLIEELERQHSDLSDDMAVAKNRYARRSAAFEIAKLKKPVDTATKELTEEYRKKTQALNKRRADALERLEALQHKIRAPLTEWEEVEKARESMVAGVFERLTNVGQVGLEDTPESVANRIATVRGLEFTAEAFRDRHEEAERKRESVIEALEAAHARLLKEAEERAELERLRREAEERAAAEAARAAEEQRKAEEAEREKARAEAEARRVAEAEERARREAAEAAEKARLDAIRKAEQEAAAKVRAAEEETAKLRREAEAKEAAERQAREAQAKREANQKHRAKVAALATAAIAKAGGIAEQQAEKIATAIKSGDVPHVSMNF